MANKVDNAFKTAPSHQELRAMDRDLRFYPSTVVDPAALSAEQIAAYNRDGYIKGLRIFDEAESPSTAPSSTRNCRRPWPPGRAASPSARRI